MKRLRPIRIIREGLLRITLPPLTRPSVEPTEDALQLVAELSRRHIPVLVCSMQENAIYVRRALKAGAGGYITKPEAPQGLAHAVRDVLNGWTLISPHATDGLR